MNTVGDSSNGSWQKSSLLGVVRGVTVHSIIFPLEVIKIQQQASLKKEMSYRIAANLLRTEGIGGFYRGIVPQLVKTSLKQAWCWPIITELPKKLERYRVNPYVQQFLTGLSIATIDAAITTPLERLKILTIVNKPRELSFKNIYKEGWYGFRAHWSKLSVSWVLFLLAQKYFRERYREKSGGQPLSLPQLMDIGIRVAFVVSLCTAPFDVANTLKQSRNINPISLFSGNWPGKMYRGWPLNMLALVIHNIASVILINKLN